MSHVTQTASGLDASRLDVPAGSRDDPRQPPPPSKDSPTTPRSCKSCASNGARFSRFYCPRDAELRQETTVPSMPFFGGANSPGLDRTRRMPGTLSARLSARCALSAEARDSAPKAASGRGGMGGASPELVLCALLRGRGRGFLGGAPLSP